MSLQDGKWRGQRPRVELSAVLCGAKRPGSSTMTADFEGGSMCGRMQQWTSLFFFGCRALPVKRLIVSIGNHASVR